MSGYFLGIDIGASKSQAVIANEQGQVVGVGKDGPGNHEGVGLDGFRAVLNNIVDQACTQAGINRAAITGVGLGVAGYDWPSDYQPLAEIIDSLGLSAPYEMVNDAVLGLIAGAQQGWGLSVVAGTGNNCRGRDQQGREGRVAGVSFWTGEHGGGSDLTRRAVAAVWKAWSKRGPETKLTEKFLSHVDAKDALEMVEGLSRGRYYLGAAEAPLVFETANEGDAVAQECIRWMGRELADLAVGVIRQLHFETLDFEVVLTGSLYKGSPLIRDTMREVIQQVAPGAQLVYLKAPPVLGGVLLGMEKAGFDSASIRDYLMDDIKKQLQWTEHAADEE